MKPIKGKWYKFHDGDDNESFIKYSHKKPGQMYFTESINRGVYEDWIDYDEGVDWWDAPDKLSEININDILKYLPKNHPLHNRIIEIY